MDSLTIVLIAALVVVVAAAAFLIGKHGSKHGERDETDIASNANVTSGVNLQASLEPQISTIEPTESQLPPICFEEAVALSPHEDRALVEVTDPNILALVDATIPMVVRSATNAVSIKNVSSAINTYNAAVDATGPVYRAIIPQGTKLANSRSMEGAVRGLYHGSSGIRGHANWQQVSPTKLDSRVIDTMKVAGAVDAVMSIGAMLIGQYYMTQINYELKLITKEIEGIAEFQNLEYRSKVKALISQVRKSSEFHFEIMESEKLRHDEVAFLREREHECIELLNQANGKLATYADKYNPKMSFEVYEQEVAEADEWLMYQQTLFRVLTEIAKLTYAFNMGEASLDYCTAMCSDQLGQANEAISILSHWDDYMITIFGFNADRTRRSRNGLSGTLMSIPGLFNDELNYLDVNPGTTQAIKRQMSDKTLLSIAEGPDVYQQNVNLVLRDGKIYYLPEVSEQ